jgi:YebC/PmpR family DNA-binding regulatory protein
MSGHSKWSTIKRKKGINDAKKGVVFTKLAKELSVAAKVGGSDPAGNVRLRLAMQKAREANMPMVNVERAIKRGSGESGEVINYEEIVYEGYGPNGIAVLVDIMTDNRNRVSSEVRHAFSKHGGNLGETGCVAWMFETKGIVVVDPAKNDRETLLLTLIDLGAEDVNDMEDAFEASCTPDHFETLKDAINKEGLTIISSEITKVPKNTVSVTDEKLAKKLLDLLEVLEENEDVQKAYANADIDETILNSLGA